MANGKNILSYENTKSALNHYFNSPNDFDDKQLEKLAKYAKHWGLTDKFQVESKPIRKGAFDLLDMPMFGLLPNEWRPYSPGQDIIGESTADRIAGGIGTIGGLGLGIGAGIKGAQWLMKAGPAKAADAVTAVKKTEAANRARNLANNVYNRGNNIVGLGKNPYNIDFSNLRLMP